MPKEKALPGMKNIYGTLKYPQYCLCQNPEPTGGRVALVANDCHIHNVFPMHFMEDEGSYACDCE